MARPHIMFVQAQMIPWRAGLHGDARPEVEHKLLSIDDADCSSTCILRYPAGWSRKGPEHLTTHEEFLVLDGCIEIDGHRYEKHHYAFLPASARRRAEPQARGALRGERELGEGIGAEILRVGGEQHVEAHGLDVTGEPSGEAGRGLHNDAEFGLHGASVTARQTR